MNKKKKNINTIKNIYIYITSATIFLLILSFYIFYSVPYWNSSVLWKDIEISGIKLKDNGPEYKISKGFIYKNGEQREIKFEINFFKLVENEKVLRLALFYQILKEDPLFYSPGLNIDYLDNSVAKLSSTHKELKDILKLDKNVIPVDFLNAFVGLTVEHKEAEKNKVYKNFNNIILSYKKVLNLYKDSSSSLLSEIGNEDRSISLAGSVSSVDIIKNDLNKIIVNGNFLEKEINSRNSCLKYSTIFCKRMILNKNFNIDDVRVSNESDDLKILNKDSLHFTKDIDNAQLFGPYKIESTCYTKDDNRSHYMYAIKEDIKSGERITPKFATTNYYRKIKEIGGEPIDPYYIRHGYEWKPILVTTYYGCNNLTYQADLATVNYYSNNFKGSNIVSEFYDKYSDKIPHEYLDIFKNAKALELAFGNGKYPSYKTLDNISEIYLKIYSIVVKEQNLKNKFEWFEYIESLKNEVLKRGLIAERKLVDFDTLINFYSYILEGYVKTTPIIGTGGGDIHNFIYQTRNGYSLLYLGFSPSVWRSSDNLQYIDNTFVQLNQSYLDYDNMVKKYGYKYVKDITGISRNDIWYEITGQRIE